LSCRRDDFDRSADADDHGVFNNQAVLIHLDAVFFPAGEFPVVILENKIGDSLITALRRAADLVAEKFVVRFDTQGRIGKEFAFVGDRHRLFELIENGVVGGVGYDKIIGLGLSESSTGNH
jgi:hypothetical protein